MQVFNISLTHTNATTMIRAIPSVRVTSNITAKTITKIVANKCSQALCSVLKKSTTPANEYLKLFSRLCIENLLSLFIVLNSSKFKIQVSCCKKLEVTFTCNYSLLEEDIQTI